MITIIEKDKGLLDNLIGYLVKPIYQKQLKVTKRKKIIGIFKLWSLAITIVMIIGLGVFEVSQFFNVNITENSLIYSFFEQPWYIVVFFVLIWAPVTEELTFRLGLRFSYYKLGFTISFFAFIFFDIIFRVFDGFFNTFFEWLINISRFGGFIFYLGFIIVLGLLFSNILKRKFSKKSVESFYQDHFKLIFYSSAILFALLHLFNYYNISETWFLIIFLILPQFILGLILGFIRMYYGLIWSMITHLVHNAILTVPILLLDSLHLKLVEAITNDDVARLENITNQEVWSLLIILIIFIFISLAIIVSLINIVTEFIKLRK